MGFIRGGLVVIIGILLFLSLLLGNIFLVLSMSLQYDTVKSELGPLVKELVLNQSDLITKDFNLTEEMEEAREFMVGHCQNNTEYNFSEGEYNFVLPCYLVNETPETFLEQGIDSIIEQTYYKEYDCGFWNCFGEDGLPFFLISEKAKDYWKEKFYFSLLTSLVLIILIFFLIEQKQNFPLLFGSLLVISSLPLLKLGNLTSVIGGQAALQFTSFFFNESSTVFWMIFILGLVVLGFGIALRLWKPGTLKKKFSKEDVKEIVKKEISKVRSNVNEDVRPRPIKKK